MGCLPFCHTWEPQYRKSSGGVEYLPIIMPFGFELRLMGFFPYQAERVWTHDKCASCGKVRQ